MESPGVNSGEVHPLLLIARDDQRGLYAAVDAMADTDVLALVEQAASNRLLPALTELSAHPRFSNNGVGTMLRRLSAAYKMFYAVRVREYDSVLTALDDARVRAVVLKGHWLARAAYQTPWHREYTDLDVLVAPTSLDSAAAVLEKLGYRQAEIDARGKAHGLSAARLRGYEAELQHLGEYVRQDSTSMTFRVDLHHRLSTVFDHIRPDAIRVIERSRRGMAEGVDVWTPQAEDLIAHLCYHAWWDTQSVDNVRKLRDLRLYQYVDIHRAAHVLDAHTERVLRSAAELGCEASAHFGLQMASDLVGPLPGDHEAIDLAVAEDMGRRLADRWIQRSTDAPFAYWRSPASVRILDPRRAIEALELLFDGFINARLRQGDILSWQSRDEQ